MYVGVVNTHRQQPCVAWIAHSTALGPLDTVTFALYHLKALLIVLHSVCVTAVRGSHFGMGWVRSHTQPMRSRVSVDLGSVVFRIHTHCGK